MRFFFTTVLIALLLVSCKNDKALEKKDVSPEKEKHSLVGVWKMVGYYNYQDNKVSDSFMSNERYQQIKIYSPSKVMWSRLNRIDSTDWFGYGDYKITDSTLVESLVYGSNTMKPAIETNNVFSFELILNGDTFSQISIDENGDRVLAENYIRIE
ncbi:hypothetical protein L3X39_13550 [Sabulilitoribacter multivorans]|uniref:Lipocalin-like domain-containing protein n=1 Tax=Flaviramulus multivorans TaxID=1304750 RepID=A0ABS9IM56_9FLAO|nr:hypothetical protein [Flaviramulus multivorans]MCF7561667.1 hypothetical protein [Flaviramulus multivorans]